MKYQSELIEEIVDTRGHKESSLHYESECIETWIKEAKGAYPKLCDYESEWLNYISILDDTGGSEDPKPPIGEFPYVVLSDVTEATIDNVVPYAYKSAILKGNTLSAKPLTVIGNVESTINADNSVTMIGNGGWHHVDYESSNFVGNKATFVILFSENTVGYDLTYFQFSGFNVENNVINTNSFKWYGTITGNTIRFGLKATVQSGSVTFRMMLLDGDCSNHDISYFEGMQSVKMPVLTTSNGDGTKTNILTVNEDVELRGVGNVKDELDLMTGELTQRIGEVVLDENNSTNFILKGISDNTLSFWCLHNASSPFVNISKGEDLQTLLCDKITRKTNFNEDVELIHSGTGAFVLRILKNKLQTQDINGLTLYLQSNPITVQYKLATESVKTVDLNIQDQNGKTLSVIKPIEGKMYLSTSSDTIKPLFSGEIPVEAITQNLASFIDLETEE